MPKDWQSLVSEMTDVQRLVHLAARQDSVAIDDRRATLLRQRRQAYEDELTIQARRVGCPGQRGRLGGGDILSKLNEESKKDAESIANTYNYHLATAIIRIAQEKPRANRFVYSKNIGDWEQVYWGWKQGQIDQMTEGTARVMAQQDFERLNRALGRARLMPKDAVCPVCKGIVARGWMPLRVALNNPPPFHPNCPHILEVDYEKIAREDCGELWTGQ